MDMTIKIQRKTGENSIRKKVEEMSGVDLSLCYQCKKCTGGCPVAGSSKSPPSEIIRKLHLGAGTELLSSDIVWLCLSCETCYARCPMQINFPAVVDALRALAVKHGVAATRGNMPLFNRMFLKTVQGFGRSYDLAMIMGYKLGSGSLMNDAEKFPVMLKKGKMAIMPPAGADKKTVRRVFKKSKEGGAGK